MPGEKYLDSIIKNYRCYSGLSSKSKKLCKLFFESFLDYKNFPLTCLSSIDAAEMAKIIENSYRAVNIAFIEEWAEFSENVGINLNEVLSAIRQRDTHKNIARPGIGVGGYCLTKDPLFGIKSAEEIFNLKNSKFPFSKLAIETNQYMTKRCFNNLKKNLRTLKNKNILILGASYKSNVADDRFSPSLELKNIAIKNGAKVTMSDPFLKIKGKLDYVLENNINKINFDKFDAIIFSVDHEVYRKNKNEIIFRINKVNNRLLIFDACGFLNERNISILKTFKKKIFVVGRGVIE